MCYWKDKKEVVNFILCSLDQLVGQEDCDSPNPGVGKSWLVAGRVGIGLIEALI